MRSDGTARPTRQLRATVRFLAVAALAAAVLAAACGGTESAPVATAPAPPADPPPAPGPSPAPESPPADAAGANDLPAVTVVDVVSGESLVLSSLAPANRPILLWFWAPH